MMLPRRTFPCKCLCLASKSTHGAYVRCHPETLLPSPPLLFRPRGLYGAQSVRFRQDARCMATSSDNLVGFGQRHVTAGIGRLTEAVMSKGEGSYLSFEDGRRMLDFSCGIGVTNLGKCTVFALLREARPTLSLHRGHCHPKVSRAAADQCASLVHGQVTSLSHHLFMYSDISFSV